MLLIYPLFPNVVRPSSAGESISSFNLQATNPSFDTPGPHVRPRPRSVSSISVLAPSIQSTDHEDGYSFEAP